jgi:hypothetical protein
MARSITHPFLVSMALAVTLVPTGCNSSGTGRARAGYRQLRTPPQSAAVGRAGGLSITLKAAPGMRRAGDPVQFTLTADEQHAFGAFGYRLLYGDGRSSANAVPMSCLAGMGVHNRQTWYFAHTYHTPGQYVVSAHVYANCTADRTTVTLTLRVT